MIMWGQSSIGSSCIGLSEGDIFYFMPYYLYEGNTIWVNKMVDKVIFDANKSIDH